MRAVDTNLLLRLIVQDDGRQAAAAEAFIESGAWVSNVVLAETVWVLGAVYERDSGAIATAVELLLNHRSLVVQDADAVAAALKVLRSRPSLRFSDCLILELARKSGNLPLGTFDRRLAKTEGARAL